MILLILKARILWIIRRRFAFALPLRLEILKATFLSDGKGKPFGAGSEPSTSIILRTLRGEHNSDLWWRLRILAAGRGEHLAHCQTSDHRWSKCKTVAILKWKKFVEDEKKRKGKEKNWNIQKLTKVDQLSLLTYADLLTHSVRRSVR